MKLKAEDVCRIFLECLFKEDEDTNQHVMVDGITSSLIFHPGRLENHRTEIEAMLDELPEEFHKTSGGGWSFLQACNDKHGNQWTGLHRTMEQLFQLGIGIGRVKCLLPKELWRVLPGGMPYYMVLEKGA